jgi:hypothetical protein
MSNTNPTKTLGGEPRHQRMIINTYLLWDIRRVSHSKVQQASVKEKQINVKGKWFIAIWEMIHRNGQPVRDDDYMFCSGDINLGAT